MEPRKRVIQKQVLDPLSLKIVSGEIKKGERVIIDLEAGQIIFRTAKDLARTPRKREKSLVR